MFNQRLIPQGRWIAALLMVLLGVSGVQAAPTADASTVPTNKKTTTTANVKATTKAPVIGWLEIEKPLRQGPSPFAWVDDADAGLSLTQAVRDIDRVAQDPSMSGLVISLNNPKLTLMQIDELSKAIARVRAQGKKVMTFAESYDMSSYMLAVAADKILLQHKGMVELHGLGVEEMYFAGLLEKVGAKADFLQVGKFKGAEEPLTRTGPSDDWSKNFDALLDDMYSQIIARISKARGLSKTQIEKLFVDAWSLSDQQLVKRKVIDQLCDHDLSEATSKLWGDDFTWVDFSEPPSAKRPQNPLAMMSLLFQPSTTRVRRASIATIWAQGEITGGKSASHAPSGLDSSLGGGMFGGANVGSKTIVSALEKARDNPLIKGVVVFIDSPGGSALASELMWQAMRNLTQTKPVFVVVGSMAASGGYYLSCAANEIYVSPASIVGSIGVVGGKIVLGGLYKKLGIAVHRRTRGPMGGMFNSVDPFTPDQRAALEKAFEHTYEQFLERVSTGRGKRLTDVNKVAQGRLFTGRQAVKNRMADKLGGMKMALSDMATKLNLKPGQYDVVSLPAPMSLSQFLDRTFGSFISTEANIPLRSAVVASARELLGPQAWSAARPVLSGLLLLQHEPILTLMPAAIVIH